VALVKKLPLEPKFRFVDKRVYTIGFSACLVVLSIVVWLVQGLAFGVDFRGGILLQVKTNGPAQMSQLRSAVAGLGLGEIGLQGFGAPDEVVVTIQMQPGGDEAQQDAVTRVKEALGDRVADYERQEIVGPKVSSELIEAGILATVLALAAIGVYIWFRFEWQFSVAALAALLHDVITTIGFFSLTQMEFNLSTVAAVLTIAGYSINDTVVVFDRIREELRRYKKLPMPEVLDLSLNSTLSRTLMTSLTTLLALVALFAFGGEIIRGFSVALIWGIVIGTYSSLGVATPLLLILRLKRPGEVERTQEETADAAG
jgi:preprotein translocase subunit SecF